MARTTMLKAALASISIAVSTPAFATLAVGTSHTDYVIDFDTTVAGVNNGQFAGSGFAANPAAGQLDSDAWTVTGMSDGADLARGVTTAAQTTGGIYGFGSTSNRSMMIQPGGDDFTPGTLTLRLQNTSSVNYGVWDISYDLSVRNDQARSSSFNFSYSTNGVDFTPVASLNYTSPAAAVGSAVSFVGTQSTSIPLFSTPGSFLYVRWSSDDVGGSGSRDEFFLDNITISAIPEPTAALFGSLLAGAFGLTVARRPAGRE